MSLYVRVMNSFYGHRKTLLLKSIIGDAAFWVPPRIWAYASAQQADGCFDGYTAPVIANAIGYAGDANALLEALLQVGFMDADPLRIHDWDEHNGYHATYAKRAKVAAEARWDHKKKDQEREREIERSIASSNASSIHQASVKHLDEVLEGWNAMAVKAGLSRCIILSPGRRRALSTRLKDEFFRINWANAIKCIGESAFCRGQNDRGWKASFDWFVTPDAVVKVMEGKYANAARPVNGQFRLTADDRAVQDMGGKR